MEDLIEDEAPDFNESEEDIDTIEEKPPAAVTPPMPDPELMRRAEEKERKRRQIEAADEQIREASLRAWEKERLADAEGRLLPFDDRDPCEYRVDKRVPRVAPSKAQTPARYERRSDAQDDAETELTAVIAECRYFMREMAFESARMTPIASDRLRFIESARSLAEVSAKVGHSVAIVRNPALGEPGEKKKRTKR